MGLDLWLTVLGFPFEILKDLTLDKIEAFFEKIEPIPLQRLFIDSFYTSLDCQAKQYGRWFKRSWIKKLEKSIKKDETEFVKIFTLKAANYNALIPDFETGKLSGIVTQDIINRFKVEENFKDIMILIVQDCLKTYRAAFFKTMTEKQGIELLILLQGFNLETTIKAIESIKQELVPLFKEILKREAENDKESIMPKKKGKQIKILSITASPDDVDDIYYEKEQDTLLDAFRDFNRDEVYLDMPDPFKSTLDEIKERLKDGKHDILHITAHGGINDNGEGYLCFEDHGGKLEKVTGSQLAGVLKKLNPTPLIVILSSCHSARRESNLMPVARALYGADIIAVIGMDKSISHDAAIDFNVIFFTALCRKLAIKVAFELGKTAILNGEQRRIKENPKWNFLKEYEIPQLLTRRKILNVRFFSDYRIEAPGRPQSHHFQGAKYLERGFIGRRQVLRDIFRAIENKQGAVVLKGPGGIGKSTLTTRAAANLLRKGYELIVLRGDTSEVKILEAISNKAEELGVAGAKEMYGGGAEPVQKLGWFVEHFLLPRKVMIIFDNFEENQDEERGSFVSSKETLKQFIWRFQDYLKNKESFLFFSTRCALPGFESPNITLDIPEFTQLEFRKMLWNRDALQWLDKKSIETLRLEIGGNPRALELLDRIAYSEFGKQDYNWEQLKDLIPELRQRIIEKKSGSDDFAPLFLDKLIGYLSPDQRLILEVLSIYRNPVPKEAIEIQGAALARTDRKRLADLSLLECIEIEKGHLYYVHRLTAQYILDVMETAVKNKYHLQAAQYFEGIKDEEGKSYVDVDIEARWHFLQAGEWDRAAEITFAIESYLTQRGFPQWSTELLQELEDKVLTDKNRSVVYHQMGNLFLGFGDYDAALMQYEKSLEIREKIGDIAGMANSMGQMGDLHFQQQEFETALKYSIQAFLIFSKIGSPNADKTKSDIARCREKMTDERFQALLKEFEISPKKFDPKDNIT